MSTVWTDIVIIPSRCQENVFSQETQILNRQWPEHIGQNCPWPAEYVISWQAVSRKYVLQSVDVRTVSPSRISRGCVQYSVLQTTPLNDVFSRVLDKTSLQRVSATVLRHHVSNRMTVSAILFGHVFAPKDPSQFIDKMSPWKWLPNLVSKAMVCQGISRRRILPKTLSKWTPKAFLKGVPTQSSNCLLPSIAQEMASGLHFQREGKLSHIGGSFGNLKTKLDKSVRNVHSE